MASTAWLVPLWKTNACNWFWPTIIMDGLLITAFGSAVLVQVWYPRHQKIPEQYRCNTFICWPLLSNQSFYRQIAGYGMGIGDHRVGRWWKRVMGQQNSCKTHILLRYFLPIPQYPSMHLCLFGMHGGMQQCHVYMSSTTCLDAFISAIISDKAGIQNLYEFTKH